ncbi:hypothetical protein KEM52_004307, partial [Ascosphaera acerosa]
AGAGRAQAAAGGEDLAARRRRERQVDDRQADEDPAPERVQRGGAPVVPRADLEQPAGERGGAGGRRARARRAAGRRARLRGARLPRDVPAERGPERAHQPRRRRGGQPAVGAALRAGPAGQAARVRVHGLGGVPVQERAPDHRAGVRPQPGRHPASQDQDHGDPRHPLPGEAAEYTHVRRRRPAQRAAQVDPLLRERHRDHLLRRAQRIRSDVAGGSEQ